MTGSPRARGLVTLGETMGLVSSSSIGRLSNQNTMDLRIGGAESNVAIAVARLGGTATWIGRIGNDGIGELILARLRAEGITVRAVADPGPTSLMVKELRTPSRSRVTYYRVQGPGSRLRPADVMEEDIAGAALLHLTGITMALSDSAKAAVHAAADIAVACGVPVSFDVNYRSALWSTREASVAVRELLGKVDVVFAGDGEAELLLPDARDDSERAQRISDLGPREVIIKKGDAGAGVWDGNEWLEVPAVPVTAVDPVGAGDAFAGGYLVERMAGASTGQRMSTATACGAYAVTGVGDCENLPTRADLAWLTPTLDSVER